MATCRFHPRSEAEAYCATCRARFCRRCARPGKTCALCQRTTLQAPPTSEPPPKARMPAPAAPPPKAAPKARRPEDLSYTGGLNPRKGWRRRMTRSLLGALVLAGVFGILSAQYGAFKDLARKASESRRPATPAREELDRLWQQLEAGAVSDADVEATEKLMARIQGGEALDPGQRQAWDLLARRFRAQGAPPQAGDPQARKLWALLSDWANEDERPAPAPARPKPSPTQPVPWRVSLLSPAPGATVKGQVAVRARIEGQGYIERVEFLVDGEWLGLSNRPPFTFDWDTTGGANGSKVLQVVAYEPSGARHASKRLRVMVTN